MSESLAERILNTSRKQEDKTAFIYYENGNKRTLSYANFRRLIAAFSLAIGARKIPSHSLIFLMGENSPKWPAAYLGAHLCGHTVIHGDVGFTKHQVKTVVEFANPSLILCEKKFSANFEGQREKIFFEDIILLSSPDGPLSFPDGRLSPQCDLKITPLAANQPMSLIFTSGTTGSPKGVMLSESNFLSNLTMFESKGDLISSKDKFVAILPFHHVYPFTCTVLAPLYFGATSIYPVSLRGEDIFGAIKEHGGTILVAIPKVLELFGKKVFDTADKLPKVKRGLFHCLYNLAGLFHPFRIRAGKIFFRSIHTNFPSFRFFACGGAHLEVKVNKRLTNLGFKIIEAYGLTETSPIAAINEPDNPVFGSVGKPSAGIKIKIEKPGPHLKNGEICIKGPNVMMGYYKRPDLTEKAVIKGWFHSGDLGYFDQEGSLFITGRKDEMIVLSNGKNIYPEELEKYYQENEGIKELCISLLKEEGKEYLTAVVYPDKEFFRRHKIINIYHEIKYDIETIAQKLPMYQRVSRIELVDEELPRTSLGKIKRYKIREMLKEKGALLQSKGVREIVSSEKQDIFLVMVKDFLRLKEVPSLKSNLETDLGLDSLSKLELFSAIEKRYGIKIGDEQAGGLFTLADIKEYIPQNFFLQDNFEEQALEYKILVPPEPALKKHVDTGNNPLMVFIRFCFHLCFKVALKLFFRATLEGKEYLDSISPPYIIAPNHLSYIDGLIVYGLLPFRIINECFFLSFPQYFSVFPLSLIRNIGRIILTGTQDTAVKSLQYSYQVLKSGKIMCIFPEGGRSLDWNIKQPKRGVGFIAKQSEAFLVPIYISGSQALYSRKSPGFHRSTIKMNILYPLHPQASGDDLLLTWQKELQEYHERKDKFF